MIYAENLKIAMTLKQRLKNSQGKNSKEPNLWLKRFQTLYFLKKGQVNYSFSQSLIQRSNYRDTKKLLDKTI